MKLDIVEEEDVKLSVDGIEERPGLGYNSGNYKQGRRDR